MPWIGFRTFHAPAMLFDGGKNVRRCLRGQARGPVLPAADVHVHLMDDGLGRADFLDEAVQVGKGWARQHPETAATAGPRERRYPRPRAETVTTRKGP